MRSIDPYSVHLFVSAVKQGSLGRAAEREHIACSALSRRIARLERLFGAPLLVRSQRGVVLTEAGRVVFDRSTKIEGYLEALARDVQSQSKQVCGTVRLFANGSCIVGFLPERLKQFSTDFPLVEVALQQCSSDEVIGACVDGRADAGISINPARSIEKGIQSWHFADDRLIVITPHQHPLAHRRSLRFAEVLEHHLVYWRYGALSQLLDVKAAALGMPLKTRVIRG